VAARAVLLIVAIAAVAWLGSAYAGVRDEGRAAALSRAHGGRLDRAERDRLIALLDAARRRRPDSLVVPREAGQLVLAGRPQAAAALLRPLLRAEPENATGWAVLAIALARSDPPAARAAAARRRSLVPPLVR
jgi:predicted Zn-dependent protease